ncbi:hypothetical protein AZI86_12450 [Bdellovibrio bacteriovorus]|uniref:BON domain-containing protein n=1 Tax=Bdellovibrio bacteriovorus TaxID=959 RepID=A0A150WJ84_BDEBC|nr:BON domain-containing protein [Bdellovibrio bacteriovorus]KYG63635.1 hypothetical protein AZI86_12450 [Bdellovibrio bacteriovorus]
MRNQRFDRERQNRNNQNQNRNNQDRDYGYSERNAGGRGDWYDRDPMDDRSGYRNETDEENYSSRRDSSDIRGYNDHYRYDQNYHNYYGSTNYNPDRERTTPSSYDSDRYSRGQGAYGTTSSGQASWDTGMHPQQRRSRQDYGRQESTRNERTSQGTSYGATQGSWSPSEETEKDNSYYGRGPKNFKRSDERIREEVCEMLTRHSGIDADEIDVEVKDGEVTLTGSVSERRMKHLAEDCAEQCFGVKDVTNNIRVKRSMDSEVSDRGDFGSGNRDRSVNTSSTKKSSSSGSTPGH